MAKTEKAKVTQNPDAPVERNILAQAIVDISRAAKKLADGGVNREAVIVLIQDRVGGPKSRIRAVLNSLADLEREFCR